MLSFLLNPIYKLLAIVGGVLAAIGVIYAKGRSDASARARLKSLEETQNAIDRAFSATDFVG